MSSTQLRRKIKQVVDRMPADRLESLADFAAFLAQPVSETWIAEADKAINAGKGVNWRKVRRDVYE